MKRTTITIQEFAGQVVELAQGASISFYVKVKEWKDIMHTATAIIFHGEPAVDGDCEGGGHPFHFEVEKYNCDPLEICKMLDEYINGCSDSHGYVDIMEEDPDEHEFANETPRKLCRYMLISVTEREITTALFPTYEPAYAEMAKELDETMNGDRAEYGIGDKYNISECFAWSNANDNARSDWLIVPIDSDNPEGAPKVYSLEEMFILCLKEGKDSSAETAAQAVANLCNPDYDDFGVMYRYIEDHPAKGIEEINLPYGGVIFKESTSL